jgi:hypothetical protein
MAKRKKVAPEEVINRQSYIVSRTRLDETYFGRSLDIGEEPIASHLILVPASSILLLESKENLESIYVYSRSNSFFYYDLNFEIYKEQLEEEFGESPPLAVVSHDSILIFIRDYNSFKTTEATYDFIANNWCFDGKMGYGRHFLQLAYVNANRNFEDIPDEEFANFSLDNPLGALLGNIRKIFSKKSSSDARDIQTSY